MAINSLGLNRVWWMEERREMCSPTILKHVIDSSVSSHDGVEYLQSFNPIMMHATQDHSAQAALGSVDVPLYFTEHKKLSQSATAYAAGITMIQDELEDARMGILLGNHRFAESMTPNGSKTPNLQTFLRTSVTLQDRTFIENRLAALTTYLAYHLRRLEGYAVGFRSPFSFAGIMNDLLNKKRAGVLIESDVYMNAGVQASMSTLFKYIDSQWLDTFGLENLDKGFSNAYHYWEKLAAHAEIRFHPDVRLYYTHRNVHYLNLRPLNNKICVPLRPPIPTPSVNNVLWLVQEMDPFDPKPLHEIPERTMTQILTGAHHLSMACMIISRIAAIAKAGSGNRKYEVDSSSLSTAITSFIIALHVEQDSL